MDTFIVVSIVLAGLMCLAIGVGSALAQLDKTPKPRD